MLQLKAESTPGMKIIPCYKERFVQVVEDIHMNKIISCGIDERSWKHSINSYNLQNTSIYAVNKPIYKCHTTAIQYEKV